MCLQVFSYLYTTTVIESIIYILCMKKEGKEYSQVTEITIANTKMDVHEWSCGLGRYIERMKEKKMRKKDEK